ncbi:multidrug MFS transporter [Paenibacillus sp. BIHB 4019]|uniref:Multidrug MFS transporter n=1 Tax=Paenibacillus sp. BIHB 4019 TaxID=1870819 RepID=A0A1B2DHI1_9BACL|nr:DHA2 family efflux MFS transporter permease subunit [Paenibacillus sp. BIHB 4019]ANY67187.1 multidrug MFS transporter [Paenibacillus sp. BIHB 4019]
MNTGSLETAPKDLSGIKRGPIVAALIIGAFVAILNETLLNIAFPDLMKEFDISYATIQWLSTAYLLVVGILVPITALLQQWFTTRQMFLSAMILFLVGTVVCGTATIFPMLLVGRVIQALGTGLMLPVMMNTILVIFPPEKRGGAMGMIGLVIMSAPAIGPTLSGLIIESFNWRWLFFLVIPLAVFSILFAAVYLKNVSDITRPKVDLVSILLSSIGFGGLIYGFSKAGEDGWGSSIVIWSIVVGAIALLLFIVKQLMSSQPLLDLRAFKYPMFSLVALLMLVMMMTLFSTMILLPLFLQNALGKTALAAGLILLPGGIINGLMAPVSGVLFDKFGPRVLVIPGLAITAAAVWMFNGIDELTSIGYIIFIHIVLLIGVSMVMMPAQTTALNQLPRKLYPHGTAILNTLQQVAGAIGTALFISIMSSGTKKYLESSTDPGSPLEQVKGFVSGMHSAFLVGLIIAFIAFGLGLFIRRTKAPDVEEKRAA